MFLHVKIELYILVLVIVFIEMAVGNKLTYTLNLLTLWIAVSYFLPNTMQGTAF